MLLWDYDIQSDCIDDEFQTGIQFAEDYGNHSGVCSADSSTSTERIFLLVYGYAVAFDGDTQYRIHYRKRLLSYGCAEAEEDCN